MSKDKKVLQMLGSENAEELFKVFRGHGEIDHRILINPENAEALKTALTECAAPDYSNPCIMLPDRSVRFVQDYSEPVYSSILWPRAVIHVPSFVSSSIRIREKWRDKWIANHPRKMVFSTEREIMKLESEGKLAQLVRDAKEKEKNVGRDEYMLIGKYEERVKDPKTDISYFATHLIIGLPSLADDSRLALVELRHLQYSKRKGSFGIRDKSDEREFASVGARFPRTYYAPSK